MSKDNPDTKEKSVLGLYHDENEMRDAIAQNIEIIEKGMILIDIEHVLDNRDGSGGRVDILAQDILGQPVCIELKRSDKSARSTLNELSKYVNLLSKRDRIQPDSIRCLVISTHWTELKLPLSYFAKFSNTNVMAFEATSKDQKLEIKKLELLKIDFIPQFSPDIDFMYFDQQEPCDIYKKSIIDRAKNLPFVQLAFVEFELDENIKNKMPRYLVAVCVWRINDGYYNDVENVIGKEVGEDKPYVAPGWELESDAKDWISAIPYDDLAAWGHNWTHGTPEKLSNLQRYYKLNRVVRVGDWPTGHSTNTDENILKNMLSICPSSSNEKTNQQLFQVVTKPSHEAAWRRSVSAFLKFIEFEPAWHREAIDYIDFVKNYVDQLNNDNLSVHLNAFDKRYLILGIHQALMHNKTATSFFEISIREEDNIHFGILGSYTWNGQTCPLCAKSAIDKIYGEVIFARLAFLSAHPPKILNNDYINHGFVPTFDYFENNTHVSGSLPHARRSIHDFIEKNLQYCLDVSTVLERFGPLETTYD